MALLFCIVTDTHYYKTYLHCRAKEVCVYGVGNYGASYYLYPPSSRKGGMCLWGMTRDRELNNAALSLLQLSELKPVYKGTFAPSPRLGTLLLSSLRH